MTSRRYRGRWGTAGILALVLTITAGGSCLAAQVKVPLVVDYAALNAAIEQQIYTSAGGRAKLWQGGDSCQYFYVEKPRFGPNGSALLLDTDGELSLGVAVAGKCLSPVEWAGIVEVDAAAYISGLALKIRVTDINLYTKEHRKSIIVGHGFDLIKRELVPPMETFSYDLSPALRQLEELAEMASAGGDVSRVHAAMATLRLDPEVTAEADGVRLTLEVTVPQSSLPPTTTASSAPLTPAEVAVWQRTLENWDAFFVFAIKQVGMTDADPQLRAQLLDALIDGRKRLVQALSAPSANAGPDPARILFLDEWNRMRGVIVTASHEGKLGNRTLQFLSFISAGDALFVLDQAAPALGMRVSADDLRRLARIMAPQVTADPLTYNFNEDLELQKLFGVTEPAETAGPLIAPPESEAPSSSHAPDSEASPRPEASPTQPSDHGAIHNVTRMLTELERPARSLSPDGELTFAQVLHGLGPGIAYGEERAPQGALTELGRALRGVVVDVQNADRYRTRLNRLLMLGSEREMDDDTLVPRLRKLYPTLVKAVAWQESCWRQFVIRNHRIWYLESRTGDIGLMQVNKYVWRGLYSLPRLRWDIVYNSSAGEQILVMMLTGASRHLGPNGDTDAFARSAYAAYNGGPGAYDRWRVHEKSAGARAADEGFWLKFRAISEGQSFDIVRCAQDWDRAHAQ